MEECESKNKTDKALINFLYRVKSPVSEILDKYEKEDKKQIPFDSYKLLSKKKMAHINYLPKVEQKILKNSVNII